MSRSLKKFIAFITCLAIALQIVAFEPEYQVSAAAAKSDFEYFAGTVYKYLGNQTVVDIPTPTKTGVTTISLSSENTIKSLNIPEGYTDISLANSTSIEYVSLPKSAEYISIQNCGSIKKLEISSSDTWVYIFDCSSLESITCNPKSGTSGASLEVSCCDSLKSIKVTNGYSYCNIDGCKALTTIDIPDTLYFLGLSELPSLKKMALPSVVDYFTIRNVPFDGITSRGERFEVANGGLYDVISSQLVSIDTTKKTVEVKDGTRIIGYLGLTPGNYSVSTIKLPESVEWIDDNAFSGGTTITKINIPKNVLTIGYGAFNGTGISKITIPSEVEWIDERAFLGYKGKIAIDGEADGKYRLYKDGLYSVREGDWYNNGAYIELLYYPSSKKTIEFMPGCNDIAPNVFVNSKIKTLTLPEGIFYAAFSLEGSSVTKLTLPSSVTYIPLIDYTYDCYPNPVDTAPKLKKFVVSKDNECYASYNNCLYTKDMATLLAMPHKLTKVTLHKDCVSAANYAIYAEYDWDEFVKKPLEVTFPKNFQTMGYYNLTKANFPVGSEAAKLFDEIHEMEMLYNTYASYEMTEMEFTDSSKKILKSVEAVDSLTVKAGESLNLSDAIRIPWGMFRTNELGNTNTSIVIDCVSSKNSIAEYNNETDSIEGKKRGTCTLNVTCSIMVNGKVKKKTFKIAVRVQ